MAISLFNSRVASYQFGERAGAVYLDAYASLSDDVIVDVVMTLGDERVARTEFARFDVNDTARAAVVRASIALSTDAVKTFCETRYPVSVTPSQNALDSVLGAFCSWIYNADISADAPLYAAL